MQMVFSKLDQKNLETNKPSVSGLSTQEMIDRTFLMPPEEDGSSVRAKIIGIVNPYKDEVQKDSNFIKFKCLGNKEYENVVAYNDIVDYIEEDRTWDGEWHSRQILGHKGPLKP